MTRKEEREQASFEYHSKPYLGAIKDDFVNGAEWADRTMIEKACEWLKLHTFIFESIEEIDLFHQLFRKAMEE